MSRLILTTGCRKRGILRREPSSMRSPSVHAIAQARRAGGQQGGEVDQLGHRPGARFLCPRVRRNEVARGRQVQKKHFQFRLRDCPGWEWFFLLGRFVFRGLFYQKPSFIGR
jgi:hypothetical protein